MTTRWLGLLAVLTAAAAGAGARTIRFAPDPSNFPNPERGFSYTYVCTSPTLAALITLRTKKDVTLVRQIFCLDDWRDQPIPESALSAVDAEFALAREAGVKLVPRFVYNFDQKGPDAPLNVILGHIRQLKPVLQKNADVMAFIQAGFIGRWGEWHNSSNGLDQPYPRSAVINALLDAVPADRMVAMRYPEQKKEFLHDRSNMGASDAYDGSPRSRIGFHNDCFLASNDDWGTYPSDSPDTVEEQKDWLAEETRYVVMGGETCNYCSLSSDCGNAVRQLARFHYSELGGEYQPQVLSRWVQAGCWTQISERLGYRFRLTQAQLSAAVDAGAGLKGSFTLVNDGFAAPYNPRGVELVLRGTTGAEIHLPLKADPRLWFPGGPIRVAFDAPIPAGTAPGYYYVFLNLYDPDLDLMRRPAYSIRLANTGVWEAKTGYNWLRCYVSVRRPLP